MKRALVVLLLGLMGCGGTTTVRGVLGSSNVVSASGFVSFVSFTFVSDSNGGMVNVTVVTLAQPGAAQTLTFCGTQSNLFPVNQAVRATFVPGPTCANIVEVTHS